MSNGSMINNYKERIIARLNIFEFYSKYVQGIKMEGPDAKCICPFHSERTPSFSIDLKTGLWYDHGQCKTGGSIFDFYSRVKNCDFMTSLREIGKEVGIEIPNITMPTKEEEEAESFIDKTIADTHHKLLVESQTKLDAFIEKRGISLETINRFNLGFEMQSDRYTIPIYDEHDNLVNIRKYDMNNTVKGMKMLNYTQPLLDENKNIQKDEKGMTIYERKWGSARIFNIQRLLDKKQESILMSEGETDCMIAEQNGIQTITVTCGAGTFKEEWIPLFKDKVIYICYDLDLAGQKGAMRVASMIDKVAKEVFIVTLPPELGQGGDITDFFVKFKYTAEKFKKEFIDTAKTYSDILKDEEEIFHINLAETTYAKYRAKRIRTEVLISGKNDPAYIVPSRICAYCNGGGQKKCGSCALNTEEQIEYLVDPKKPEVLEFINCTKEQQEIVFKNILGILPNCRQCDIEFPPGEFINIEEIRAVPKIDMNVTDAAYVEKTLYYIVEPKEKSEGIKTNQTYTLEGYVFPDPRKQLATIIVDRAETSSDNIEEFVMTPEKKKQLEIFQVKPGQKISAKLREKTLDMERNVTHIWEREDMLFAFDLTVFSPLLIRQDNQIIKGWINSFIIGDTATGKTEMISKMREHYGAGERIGGQGLTIPGLIGTVLQSGSGRWVLRWGLLALNDRRFLVIEEVTDMPDDIMEKLTDIMSSGTISINKANGNEKTHARTRLMFVSNTKRGAKLESYGDGPSAIREIIHKDEDIRRMDFILTVAKNEVSSDLINRPLSEAGAVEHIYTNILCRELLMWAWSRTADQIIFEEGASNQVYISSKKLLNKYHDKFPLIETGDIRNKIRRCAAALAMSQFSCDETGEKAIIKLEHVLFIEWWLDKIYSKPSMAYDMYSQDAQRKYMMTEVKRQALIDNFKSLPEWESLVKTLWEAQIFRKSDIGDRVGYEKDELRVVFKWLSNNWLIRSIGNHGYRKENNLVTVLKDLIQELEHIHNVNEVYSPDKVSDKYHKHEERSIVAPIQEKPKENRVGTEQSCDNGLF